MIRMVKFNTLTQITAIVHVFAKIVQTNLSHVHMYIFSTDNGFVFKHECDISNFCIASKMYIFSQLIIENSAE